MSDVRIIDVMREKVVALREAADALDGLLDQVEYRNAHPELENAGCCDHAQCGPCGCEVRHDG